MHEPLFPKDLWDAVNSDCGILQWNSNGTAVLVDGLIYEKMVESCHPHLTKIPTFANLRRQFRQYGFQWTIVNGDLLKFWHPFFQRDKPQLLLKVATRRKTPVRPAAKCFPRRRYYRHKTKASSKGKHVKDLFNEEFSKGDCAQETIEKIELDETRYDSVIRIKNCGDAASRKEEMVYNQGVKNNYDMINKNQQLPILTPLLPGNGDVLANFPSSIFQNAEQHQQIHHQASECNDSLKFCPFAFLGFVMNYWGNRCTTPECTHPWHPESLNKLFQSRICAHTEACGHSG